MSGASPIRHVVVLMLENRSFDHMLGTLPGVDGVLDATGTIKSELVNFVDPQNNDSKRYAPLLGACFATPPGQMEGSYGGPSHSFTSASEQRFGVSTSSDGSTSPYYGTVSRVWPVDQPVGFVS